MRTVDRLYARPWLLLVGVLIAVAVSAAFWPRFSFDASSDTLVVKGDPKLIDYLRTAQRFASDEFVVLSWRPRDAAVFDRRSLEALASLERDIEALDGVSDVVSVLDAPLLGNPSMQVADLAEGYQTLRDEDVDLAAARVELTTSALFASQLISSDGKTAALRIGFEPWPEYDALVERRNVLNGASTLTARETEELQTIESRYREDRVVYRDNRKQLIESIRAVRDQHADTAVMHLGGVPMIAADVIDYVQRDVLLFGALVLTVVMGMLWLFFRRIRWIALPLLTSAITIALLIGWLGFLDTPITVVSSNFIALIGIITISFTVHLVVRHRELLARNPDMPHLDCVRESIRSKFAPTLYTAMTDTVAFASLLTASIVPVEDFGWMMCVGVIFAFVVTFTFYPAAISVLAKGAASVTLGMPLALTEMASRLSRHHYRWILASAVVVAGMAVYGLTLISLENRFVDYFAEDSEIRQGMLLIDQDLGGTLPMEVIVTFPAFTPPDPDDPFNLDFTPDPYPERYWFTPDKVGLVDSLESYVREQPGVGSTQSVADLERVARTFNGGDPLSLFQIAAVLGAIPATVRAQLVEPLASPETGELRISARVRDSDVTIDRQALVAGIRDHAIDELGMDPTDIRVTGMLVLFEDTLQQLFQSQVNTIVWVIAATFLMFLVLLRSFRLAVVGVIPIVLAAAATISFMGFAGIALDMMTITVAAIAVGMGVDDAIHYLHRFREEFAACGDVDQAVAASHASIGRAMYFTTVIVMAGFSILVFSNFRPTVHFGILTAAAMVIALTANLTLLPSLLMVVYRSKPDARPDVPV